jgi:UDP-glucose 4-epimerase
MRCLVTGASGFLGSHLVRKLVHEGHQVLAAVRSSSDLWRLKDVHDRISFVFAPLKDVRSCRSEILTFRPEVTFHFAWTGGNSSKYANDCEQVFENVPGSLDLAQIVAEAGCSTLIYAGSSLEYGKFQIPARETDLPAPTNLYGAAKYGTEILLQGLCSASGIRFCGVRVFWTYGHMDDPSRMIPSVIASLLAGKSPSLTEGKQLWDFLFIEDAIRALLLLALTRDAEGIFNLGSGMPVAVRTVVELIKDSIDASPAVQFGAVPYGPHQVMHLEADISRLKMATGWTPQVRIEEGIRRTVGWYKENYAPRT